MERFGLFIDAGYLYAASGTLVFGERKRALLRIDFQNLTAKLAERAKENCGLDHLRTYWYDAARNAQPTVTQLQVANLPGVKLRLGRLVRTGQKGVDSRIVRDLIILSQERGISVAYLLGADEDLREGVMEAQERGVRVVLMAIEPLKNNLSPTLAMEADDVIALNRDFIKPYISLVEEPEAEPPRQPKEPIAEAGGDGSPFSIGLEYGLSYRRRTDAHVVNDLRASRPRIPPPLDQALLKKAGSQLGHAHLEDQERADIRAGFWQAITTAPDKVGDPTTTSTATVNQSETAGEALPTED